MQCGTILASTTPIQVQPPRMQKWKKPIRGLLRSLRIGGMRLPVAPSMPQWVEPALSSSASVAFASIIPGLAQLPRGQFRSIRWHWIAWLVLILMTGFFWPTPPATLFFSLAISIHVWIAVRAGVLEDFQGFRYRMVFISILAGIYFLLYYHGCPLGLRIAGVRGGYSLVNLPAKNIETGQYLFGRTRFFTLERGDMAFTLLRAAVNHGYIVESSGFVLIVGLPGETLTVQNDLFYINGTALDAAQFPVPGWLMKLKNYTTILGSDQYFIIAQLRGQGYNAGNVNEMCIVSSENFQAEAFLQWQPLRNRGFIESNP